MPLIRKPASNKPAPEPTPAEVLAALRDGSQQERWAAARAAAQVPGGADALVAALPIEQDVRVREAMFTSLARIGTAQSVSGVIPLLRSDDASLRTGALDALRAMPAAAVRESLPQLLRDADSDVRLLSCEIARRLPAADATALLCELLEDEYEANVCAAAVDVLAEVGDIAALPVLERCAVRFAQTPFLPFAIRTARDRILAHSRDAHG